MPIALRADAILGETTIYNRREALYKATDGLDGAYSTTLGMIRQQRGSKSKLGIAVLRSLSRAGRALHIDELYNSLAVNQESHDLNIKKVPSIQTRLGSCLGLVTFDRETSTVRLVHSTSIAPQGNAPGTALDPSPMATHQICLTYSNLDHTRVPLLSLLSKHETARVAHGPSNRARTTEREL